MRGFAGEGDAGAGEPASQPGGAVAVVGEEKVVNGMFLPARGAGLVRVRPGANAGLVVAGKNEPVRLGEEADW